MGQDCNLTSEYFFFLALSLCFSFLSPIPLLVAVNYIPVSQLFNSLRTFLWFLQVFIFSPPIGNLRSMQIFAHPHPVEEAGGQAKRASCSKAAQVLGRSFLPPLQESCAVQGTGWLKESRRLIWTTHKALNIQQHIKEVKALPCYMWNSHALGQNSLFHWEVGKQHSTVWKHFIPGQHSFLHS